MQSGRETTARQVVSWWRDLQPDPSKKHAGNRGALARLRRCANVTEALLEPEVQTLAQQCGAKYDNQLASLALAAVVLAHVKQDTPTAGKVARQIGPVVKKGSAEQDLEVEKALCSPLRFRKLVSAESYDECLRSFRRLVTLAGGQLNVRDLAEALLVWPREGAFEETKADAIRRAWVYEYWYAGQLEHGSSEQN